MPRRQDRIPLLSLFCGAGGMDQGFVQAGFRTALAVDNSEVAIQTYNSNISGDHGRVVDLSNKSAAGQVVAEAHALGVRGVIGGPPCQGFSNGNVTQNPRDPRNRLIYRFADMVTALNRNGALDFFAMENVTGLLLTKQKNRLARVLRMFRDAGFAVRIFTVNARNFGVPQDRRRVMLIGVNPEKFPEVTVDFTRATTRKVPTVRDAIGDLPPPIYFSRGISQSEIPLHPNHWTMKPISPRFEEQRFNRWRSFKRLDWDMPSPTVAYGNREIHVHPDGNRRLSVLEAMLLQGLDREFVVKGNFSEQITQVCNMVPPPLARGAGQAIMRALYGNTTK